MINLIVIPILFISLAVLLVIHHVAIYLWDPKGLRRYPALNLLCGITNLGYIWSIARTDGFRTRSLAEAHKAHKVIRLGPNALSFADVQAIKDIYGHSTTCVKGEMYSATAGPHRSLLDSVDKVEHATKRRRLAAAFATKNLETWEFKVVDKCTRLIAQFDRCLGSEKTEKSPQETVVDWRRWSNLFTVEAIADIALSTNLGLLEAANDRVVAEDFQGNQRTVSFLDSLHGIGRMSATIVWSDSGYHFLKSMWSLLSPWYRKQVANNSTYDDIVLHLTRERMQKYKSGCRLDDLFERLVEDNQGNPTQLDIGEITSEVSVFMNAGSDTTAISLTHVVYYLLKNPEKLQRLREELDKHIDKDIIIPTYASVRGIAYLRACIDESLRLSPSVAFGLQRKTPPEGASVMGQWIPGGTSVSVPAYVAHRDPKIFPEPESFVPERWLKEEAKEIQKYFIAFSAASERENFADPHRLLQSSRSPNPEETNDKSMIDNGVLSTAFSHSSPSLQHILPLDWNGTFNENTDRGEVHYTRPPSTLASINAETVYLLNTYQKGIGTWMDVFDSTLSYEDVLLSLVPSNPLLLNSTCALAARQLSLTSPSPPSQDWTCIAERYYGESLHLLLKTLNDRSDPEVMERAMVATILLSSYELLAFPGHDYQRHFKGAKSLVEALSAHKSSSRLTRASFWIYAHHEVGEALNLGCPTMQDPKLWPKLDMENLDPTHADHWCNDVLRICGETICFVFGEDKVKRNGKRRGKEWRALQTELDQWYQTCPSELKGVEYEDEKGHMRHWFPLPSFGMYLSLRRLPLLFSLWDLSGRYEIDKTKLLG
ncbi:hypothetical protein Plec18170_003863 [Paecilomyces lecythidis]